MHCITCGTKMAHLVEDLFICRECELISSRLEPDFALYDKSYVVKYERYEQTELGEKIQDLRAQHLLDKGIESVLDYGCGVGSFVDVLSAKGFWCQGYDVNPYGPYNDPLVLLNRHQTVTMWDVIEHIPDPIRAIKLLDPEYFFCCTPSTDDWKGDKRHITKWRHYMPGEHVHYFNKKSITKLLTNCGYEILEVNYDESKLRTGGGDKNIISVAARRKNG